MNYHERTYFTKEKDFLKFLNEKNQTIHSKLRVMSVVGLNPELLLEKDFKLEYSDTTEIDGNFIYHEAIFENKSGFHLYLSRRDLSELNYQLVIYFEPKKIKEVNFFIKNLIKSKQKNGN